MSRRRNRQSDAPGEDSFLDVVANLVGILIILGLFLVGNYLHIPIIGMLIWPFVNFFARLFARFPVF